MEEGAAGQAQHQNPEVKCNEKEGQGISKQTPEN